MQFLEKTGDVTSFEIKPATFHFVPHCVNTHGIIGSGVAEALKRKYPIINEEYVKWYNRDKSAKGFPNLLGSDNHYWDLGNIQIIGVGDNKFVCNMLAQKGFGNCLGDPPGRMEALTECLRKLRLCCIRAIQLDRKVAIEAPKFGSLRSGLDWGKIYDVVQLIFHDVEGVWTTYSYEERI
jgi:hypothetical protein